MASLSIPQPRKISDVQLIGDLMVLFERRKVKCGDPSSFEDFTSELGSNNKLRGDLFALCTAISHMASEDLSGEELLVLVARALSGTGAAKGAALPEIPENMRKAFLEGYEAWGNRASFAMEEPAVWPPPRRTSTGDGAESSPEADSEPSKPKDPAEGTRTIQEALEIARERSPNGTLGPRLNAPVPDIDHLTVSELKKLMEEIEHRVGRIGPHLGQTGGVAPASVAEVVRRDAPTPRRPVLSFESEHAASTDAGAALPAGWALGGFDEDAFLARHVYMQPTARPKRTNDKIAARSLPDSAAAEAEEATLFLGPTEVDTQAAANAQVIAAAHWAGAASRGSQSGSTKAPMEFLAEYPQGAALVSLRAKVGVVLAFAGLFLIAFTLGGIWIYRSLHPKTIYDYTRFHPVAESASPEPDTQAAAAEPDATNAAPDTKQEAPVTKQGVPATTHTTLNSHAVHAVHAGAQVGWRSKGPAVASQGSAALVWPPNNQGARDASLPDAASGSDTATSHRTSPVHVDAAADGSSTTIIGFAPKPVHTEPANGISGTVMVEISISRDGNVTFARVISGPQALWPAALQTVQQWKFKPYLVEGVPAEVTTTLGVYVKGE
jgi:TonB family protein